MDVSLCSCLYVCVRMCACVDPQAGSVLRVILIKLWMIDLLSFILPAMRYVTMRLSKTCFRAKRCERSRKPNIMDDLPAIVSSQSCQKRNYHLHHHQNPHRQLHHHRRRLHKDVGRCERIIRRFFCQISLS